MAWPGVPSTPNTVRVLHILRIIRILHYAGDAPFIFSWSRRSRTSVQQDRTGKGYVLLRVPEGQAPLACSSVKDIESQRHRAADHSYPFHLGHPARRDLMHFMLQLGPTWF